MDKNRRQVIWKNKPKHMVPDSGYRRKESGVHLGRPDTELKSCPVSNLD
jgi:hypothetical protein